MTRIPTKGRLRDMKCNTILPHDKRENHHIVLRCMACGGEAVLKGR